MLVPVSSSGSGTMSRQVGDTRSGSHLCPDVLVHLKVRLGGAVLAGPAQGGNQHASASAEARVSCIHVESPAMLPVHCMHAGADGQPAQPFSRGRQQQPCSKAFDLSWLNQRFTRASTQPALPLALMYVLDGSCQQQYKYRWMGQAAATSDQSVIGCGLPLSGGEMPHSLLLPAAPTSSS